MALDVTTKSPAPYQTSVLPQDTQEEEVVSLASGFDNEVDPFAVEQPSEFRPFSEVIDEAQAAYDSSYLEQQQASLDSTYASLSDRDKQNLEAYESKMNRSGRDRAAINRDHSKAYSYILQKREIGKDVPELNLAALMRDSKSMAHKRKDVDYYPESSSYRKGANAASEIVTTYLKDNDIPLYQETEEGTRLYLTTGTAAHFAEKPEGHGKWITAGQAGSYSTYWEPKPNLSFLEGMTANPVFRTALAVATGGTSEALIAVGKGLSGETLKTEDWISLAMPALETAGLLVPPTQGVQGSGQGVLGLSYNASEALITGVATGDPVEAIALAYGPSIVKKVVGSLGVGDALNTFASNNNINADDLNEGINKTIKSLAQGDDIEDAVLKGVGKYVLEGGTILPDAVEDALKTAGKQVAALVEPVTDVLSEINKNYIKPVTSEVGDVLSAVDTEARGLLSTVDDKVLQPLTRPVGDVLSTADTAARQGLSAFDDAVLNPAGDVIEDVGQAVGDVAEDVGQEVGDALSAAETAVRQVIGDIDLPDIDIDLPDLDLPDIDLPDIDLPDIDLNIPQVTSAPSPTRTTGGLFDVAQFEHDEGISLVGNLLTGLTEQDAKKLSKKQFQQPKEEMVDLLSNPFSSSFN